MQGVICKAFVAQTACFMKFDRKILLKCKHSKYQGDGSLLRSSRMKQTIVHTKNGEGKWTTNQVRSVYTILGQFLKMSNHFVQT